MHEGQANELGSRAIAGRTSVDSKTPAAIPLTPDPRAKHETGTRIPKSMYAATRRIACRRLSRPHATRYGSGGCSAGTRYGARLTRSA